MPKEIYMISKNDIILLLTNLEDSGVDVKDNIVKVLRSSEIPLQVLKFINDNRQLDLTSFYEKLRKNYNNKKSKLYISIVKEDTDVGEVISTLASYELQAILFSKNLSDPQMFLSHARAKEVSLVLAKYFSDYDLSTCMELLRLIRTDLKACEIIGGRRGEGGEVITSPQTEKSQKL